jgi:hypothetical protein
MFKVLKRKSVTLSHKATLKAAQGKVNAAKLMDSAASVNSGAAN